MRWWQLVTRFPGIVTVVALLSVLGLSCASQDASGSADGLGGGSSSPDAGGPSALSFTTPTLALQPGEARELAVQATPPGSYRVRFALLGQSLDAALDRGEADTDAAGGAAVWLTAPSGAGAVTTFTVRATVGTSASTALAVSVSGEGFATVEVVPRYTGTRPVETWFASVHLGTSCSELAAVPEASGELSVEGGADGEPLTLTDVPVGTTLAVTVRSGELVTGCTDVSDLVASRVNLIEVAAIDVPLQLAETDLTVVLTVAESSPPWSEVTGAWVLAAIAAARNGAADDTALLLDEMESDSGDPAAFAETRTAENWATVVATRWGEALAPTAVGDQLAVWLDAGSAELPSDTLIATLLGSADQPGYARLLLDRFAGVDAGASGFTAESLVSWTADPDDTVLLGATLYWLPSRWLAARARVVALEDVPLATTAETALAERLDCAGLALELAAQGSTVDEAFLGCNADCLRVACDAAVARIWQRARDASTAASTLELSAVGLATVGERTQPTGFLGTWVGTLTVDGATTTLSGAAAGSSPLP